MGQIKNIKLHIVTDIKISVFIDQIDSSMASILKIALAAFLIFSLVYLSEAGDSDKCKQGTADVTCDNHNGPNCIVSQAPGQAAVSGGCVTPANAATCGTTVGGTETCCCSGTACNLNMETCKASGSVVQRASFLMVALGSIVSVFFF